MIPIAGSTAVGYEDDGILANSALSNDVSHNHIAAEQPGRVTMENMLFPNDHGLRGEGDQPMQHLKSPITLEQVALDITPITEQAVGETSHHAPEPNASNSVLTVNTNGHGH